MSVSEGSQVELECTGSLEDGTIVISTQQEGKPFAFKVGENQILPAFEEQIMGMSEGEEKSFTLEPAKAYGDHNPALIQDIGRDGMPEDVQEGMMVAMQSPQGQQIPAQVVEVTDEKISLDLNHPLAGKTLNFQVKLTSVSG